MLGAARPRVTAVAPRAVAASAVTLACAPVRRSRVRKWWGRVDHVHGRARTAHEVRALGDRRAHLDRGQLGELDARDRRPVEAPCRHDVGARHVSSRAAVADVHARVAVGADQLGRARPVSAVCERIELRVREHDDIVAVEAPRIERRRIGHVATNARRERRRGSIAAQRRGATGQQRVRSARRTDAVREHRMVAAIHEAVGHRHEKAVIADVVAVHVRVDRIPDRGGLTSRAIEIEVHVDRARRVAVARPASDPVAGGSVDPALRRMIGAVRGRPAARREEREVVADRTRRAVRRMVHHAPAEPHRRAAAAVEVQALGRAELREQRRLLRARHPDATGRAAVDHREDQAMSIRGETDRGARMPRSAERIVGRLEHAVGEDRRVAADDLAHPRRGA